MEEDTDKPVLVPLNVIDSNGNTISRIPYNDHTVCIDDIVMCLMTRFAQINTILPPIQSAVTRLQEDFKDHSEAFEHTDDSLQNLRFTVSAMEGQVENPGTANE